MLKILYRNTKKTKYGISFSNYIDVVTNHLSFAKMINKAGTKVVPSVTTIQSAMQDYLNLVDGNNFALDIFDGNGTQSWPLAFMSFVSINKNVTNAIDCDNVLELLRWLAWIETNDAYVVV